jgi:hypothetical protein
VSGARYRQRRRFMRTWGGHPDAGRLWAARAESDRDLLARNAARRALMDLLTAGADRAVRSVLDAEGITLTPGPRSADVMCAR